MSKNLFVKFLNILFDENWVGKHGEKLTGRAFQTLGIKGMALRNVYLPKDNGGTSEVDIVFITQKGIFVVESKNYSGWIFGSECLLRRRQSNP